MWRGQIGKWIQLEFKKCYETNIIAVVENDPVSVRRVICTFSSYDKCGNTQLKAT